MSDLGLNEPEDFPDDAYGYLTNQISHIWLGLGIPTAYCFVLDKVSHYPSQILAVTFTVLVYFLWWELMVQGWRKLDSLEDTFFVFLGSSVYLYIEMYYVIDRVFIAYVVMALFLSFGTIRRINKDGSD